jgi:FlaA1/EpsC-like NDP-sugar epimerase
MTTTTTNNDERTTANQLHPNAAPLPDRSKQRVVLVTGGTGLVGKGIQAFIEECPEAKANESWVYLSSKV